MSNWKTKLKTMWDENPTLVLGIGTAAAAATAQVLNAATNARISRTWRKEVNRRVKKSK